MRPGSFWLVAASALALAAFAAGRVGTRPAAPPVPEVALPGSARPEPLPEALRAGNPHNLVLISIDTLRADHLSLYGYPRPTSPALDRFAADAVVFESAWSQSPKTAESHMTLFTGLYPVSHGVRNLRHDGERLSADVPTLAEILRRAGYQTAGFHGAGNLEGQLGFDRGFDAYEHPGDVEAVFSAGARWLEARARTRDARPFFLFLHTKVLHDPYTPSPEYAALFADPDYTGRIAFGEEERRRAEREGGWWKLHELYWESVDPHDPADVQHLRDLYDALIRTMDDQLAVFLERFQGLGRDRDTLFLFVSDHGEEFREHGGFRHASLHREVLHVPLVVRLPGGRGARVRETVGLVDVLPSLLEWLDLPTPGHVQGRSFAARLRGEPAESRPIYSEWAAKGVRSLRAGDWKYVDQRAFGRLYDLSADPDEERDLAREHPDVAEKLRADARRLAGATEGFAAGLGSGERFDLDAERRHQLEALGYLGGGN